MLTESCAGQEILPTSISSDSLSSKFKQRWVRFILSILWECYTLTHSIQNYWSCAKIGENKSDNERKKGGEVAGWTHTHKRNTTALNTNHNALNTAVLILSGSFSSLSLPLLNTVRQWLPTILFFFFALHSKKLSCMKLIHISFMQDNFSTGRRFTYHDLLFKLMAIPLWCWFAFRIK